MVGKEGIRAKPTIWFLLKAGQGDRVLGDEGNEEFGQLSRTIRYQGQGILAQVDSAGFLLDSGGHAQIQNLVRLRGVKLNFGQAENLCQHVTVSFPSDLGFCP